MSKIEFLREQIIEARNFVNRLVSELPEDLWFVIPEIRIQTRLADRTSDRCPELSRNNCDNGIE